MYLAAPPSDAAVLELILLVAVNGIEQVMGEVVVDVQLVVDEECARGEPALADGSVIFEREAGALRAAPVRRIESTEAIGNQAFLNGAQRYVGRAGPKLW